MADAALADGGGHGGCAHLVGLGDAGVAELVRQSDLFQQLLDRARRVRPQIRSIQALLLDHRPDLRLIEGCQPGLTVRSGGKVHLRLGVRDVKQAALGALGLRDPSEMIALDDGEPHQFTSPFRQIVEDWLDEIGNAAGAEIG